MSPFEWLLVTLLGVLALYIITRNKKHLTLPPGPWKLPLIGSLPFLGTAPYKTLQEWTKKYGPVIYLQFGSFPTIVINDIKLIKEALNNPVFNSRPDVRFFKDRSGGQRKGIIFTDGATWQEQRRFTLRHLRDFGFGKSSLEDVIQVEVRELVDRLKKKNGTPMTMANAFNGAILNALWRILTGERFQQDDPELAHIIRLLTSNIQENNTIQGVATFMPWLTRLFPKWSGYTELLKDVEPVTQFIWKAIPYHEETVDVDEPRDFLDVYIREVRNTTDTSSSFHKSNSQLDFVMVDLFIAGTETTSTALTWTFLYLTKYPKIQEKLHEEIDRVIGKSRNPCLADRPKMHYTQAIMQEVLRHSSFVPFSVFHSTSEKTTLAGFDIPAETMVLPNIYAAHHDPANFEEPDKFIPERFIKPSGEFQKSDNVIAFSYGKRVCLGETLARDEYFLFLTGLFQKFHIECSTEVDLSPFVGMLLSPKPHKFILNERN